MPPASSDQVQSVVPRRSAAVRGRTGTELSDEHGDSAPAPTNTNDSLALLGHYVGYFRYMILFVTFGVCVLLSLHVMNKDTKDSDEKFAICGGVTFQDNGTTYTCYKRNPETNEIESCRQKVCVKRCVAATCAKARGELIERLNERLLGKETELKKMKADHVTKLNQVKADHVTKLNQVKADHATELNQIKINHATELNNTKVNHTKKLQAIETSHDIKMNAHTEAIYTKGCASAPMISKTIFNYFSQMTNISKRNEYKTVVFPNCKDHCNQHWDPDAIDDEQHAFFWCTWHCVTRHVMLSDHDFQEYAIVQGKVASETAQAHVMQSLGNKAIVKTQTINKYKNSVFHNNNVFLMSSPEQFNALKDYCKCAKQAKDL